MKNNFIPNDFKPSYAHLQAIISRASFIVRQRLRFAYAIWPGFFVWGAVILLFLGIWFWLSGSSLKFSDLAYYEPLKDKDYITQAATETAAKAGFDEAIFIALLKQESNYNSFAVSPRGALGVAQIMVKTAEQHCGLIPPQLFIPELNMQCSIKYLTYLMKKFNGNIVLAVAAYNAGETRVTREMRRGDLGRLPNETQAYVRKILQVNLGEVNL